MIAVTAICRAAVVACTGIICYTVIRWNQNYPR